MFSRRRFLGASGVGILAAASANMVYGNNSVPIFGDRKDSRLERLRNIKDQKNRLLGYPVNMNYPQKGFFEWRRKLNEVGVDQFAFNNVGNPYRTSPIPYSTHDFERDTIASFGDLYCFPTTDRWGFISHSGTDSNMHGMYLGRTVLRERTGKMPVAYLTAEAHYSVQILCDLMNLERVVVGTNHDGSMNSDDLDRHLKSNSSHPALVVATIGTTFKGAVDRLDEIKSCLVGKASYVHLDAALFGGYLPHTDFASEVAYESENSQSGCRYHSIAVSCHKFFGFPAPAGLFITTKSLYEEFNKAFSKIHNPEYIHQVPGTITCSRDSVKAAEFFYFTRPESRTRQWNDARQMLDNAAYLLESMQAKAPDLSPVRSNQMSNTIYFRDPGKAIVDKYSLATMNLLVKGKQLRHAHAIVMPHVNKQIIDEFIVDLKSLK